MYLIIAVPANFLASNCVKRSAGENQTVDQISGHFATRPRYPLHIMDADWLYNQ